MTILNIAPTKSGLLTLKRQLAVAEEGYDLLEQKRQLLVFEMMKRLRRARSVERQVGRAVPPAFESLKEATLDTGGAALERTTLAAGRNHSVTIGTVHLMGLRLPRLTAELEPPGLPFGVGGTSANTDMAMKRFAALLPLLVELAELETAILRLAAELRRTQRRCNALSKIVIPNTRQTIAFIASTLEERERESFIIVRMIRDRLREGVKEP